MDVCCSRYVAEDCSETLKPLKALKRSKPTKLSVFDLRDHEKAIKSNSIPIWTCSRCTYRNVGRRSQCAMCTLSYTMSQQKASNNERLQRQMQSQQATVADFCRNVVCDHVSSIPVWTCLHCTYCNVERSSHCHICRSPYSSGVQSIPISTEQQLILESLTSNTRPSVNIKTRNLQAETETLTDTKEADDTHQSVDIARHRYTLETLKTKRNLVTNLEMPQEVLHHIPNVLSPGLGLRLNAPQPDVVEETRRRKYNVGQLLRLRFNPGHTSMPRNVMNHAREILFFGLGQDFDKKHKI